MERCCPKRCGVLYGTPSFQAAGFRRGFIGQGSCARVPLPPGRTAFLAFLLADLSLKTVPFGSGEILELGNLDSQRDWGWAPQFVQGIWKSLQVKSCCA